MSNTNSPSSFINLPKGGGAMNGMGEKFSPDLFTGTGNFSVPIALPPGRNGFQPQIGLGYSTGNGNSVFGLGWGLGLPGVTRKTSDGLPRYQDETPIQAAADATKMDVFILSGTEDLVPVRFSATEGFVEYRPRTEGLFALVRHHFGPNDDYWEVKTKDGLLSFYGTPGTKGNDPATVFDPANPTKVFSWMLSETRDPFGNRILYDYLRDNGPDVSDAKRVWNQLYLQRIRYMDYMDAAGKEHFLLSAVFEYEDRPDAFSVYQSGFEIRTRRRCASIKTFTHPDGQSILTRSTTFSYEEGTLNRVSLLKQVRILGHDGAKSEQMPPLEFQYSGFSPIGKRFEPVRGRELPTVALSQPDLDLVDLDGNGLPDLLQMNGSVRYWRNLGNGLFDLPREMRRAPAGVSLGDPGVLFMDANGEGRADLVVLNSSQSGFFPTTFKGEWDSRSFHRYRQAPSFDIQDPEVKLIDLDGDGVTDILRSGQRMELYLNDPEQGWKEVLTTERKNLEAFPNVNFSDPRVHLADMSGDGLQDIVLIHDGSVEYWPYMGYGQWSRRVAMRNSPRLPQHYDPRRILLGDIAGDGCADLIYVDNGKLCLYINQNGNGFSDAIEITGIPPVTDMDAIRLIDLYGTGTSGILFTANQTAPGRDHWFFLDLTANVKPYLLREMNNNLGAVTKVEYKPSTVYFLEDYQNPRTRWQTPLPFPVQVVARVEVIDEISKGKLSTEYRYHHGYWDGVEREFRGFGMVEQMDSETIEVFNSVGLHGDTPFINTEPKHFSPPLHTKTWFHQGPVDLEEGDWSEPDRSSEYFAGDPHILEHTKQVNDFLKTLPSAKYRREALRTLRGNILRTELYARDGSPRQDRPFTVTEQSYNLTELEKPADPASKRGRIFMPLAAAQRTTQWERGEDPMTQFSFTEDYDDFGQPRTSLSIACPRTWRNIADVFPENRPFLATISRTEFAYSNGETPYIKDRACKTSSYELKHRGNQSLLTLKAAATKPENLELIAQGITYYDGAAFTGLPFGQIGRFGATARSESLVLTEKILQDVWRNDAGQIEIPPYLQPGNTNLPAEYPLSFKAQLTPLAGYTFRDGTGIHARGYWTEGGKTQFDFQKSPSGIGRGMPMAVRDLLDRETTVQYDRFQFLAEKTTDPLGLTQTARYDYRVLQPAEAEDANGNRSRFRFSPLGLGTEFYVLGKAGENVGDPDGKPSRFLSYDFFAFVQRGEPAFVRSTAREYHATDTDVPAAKRDETITTVEYSDGFGRLLQTRVQAEDVIFGDEHFGTGLLPSDPDGTAKPGASIGRVRRPGDPENVVVSGWKVYNNKGLVVEQYEPYYDKGFGYATPEDFQFGKKSEMYYDPRGQVIRTLNPDGSEQRVIYGIPPDLSQPSQFMPTPWEAYTYDANDLAPLCKAPDGSSLTNRAPQEHHFTPAHIEIDPMGRTIKAIARQRNLRKKMTDPLPPIEEFVTLSTYDIRGNLLTLTDALGRTAFRYTYDLTFDKENGSRVWCIDSIDAGPRRMVFHALGMEIERRDPKGSLILQAFDRGNRLTHLWARNLPGDPCTLRQKLIYGDTAPQAPPGGVLAGNYKGRLFRHFDEAGLVEIHGYDFKGNPLAASRRTIRNEAVRPFLGGVSPKGFSADWESANAETNLLETKNYRSDSSFDALNRPKSIQYPADIAGERKILLPTYNKAGALESVRLGAAGGVGVSHIAYNAKGQRSLLALANGLVTRYEYEPDTFRLTRLRTEKCKRNDATFTPDGGLLQDLVYTYDLGGNITRIRDRGTGKGINGVASLNRDYAYDALYRLVDATGIEHNAYTHASDPWLEIMQQHNDDLTQARQYRQQYSYDAMGNILELRHRNLQGEAGHYTRIFQQATANNRLLTLKQGSNTYTYQYDPNGNLTREGTTRRYHWNHADQLTCFRDQPEGSAPTVDACYLYGADGMRVKKIVLNGGTLLKSSTYIGNAFEYHTQGTAENNTLHLMDDTQRIALWRIGAPLSGNTAGDPAIQYQLGDHLGSSSMAADETGKLIHREEFTPYGETAFGGHAQKRYRYTGMERDEESGMQYHSARYYLPWLGRWGSCDPIGMEGGVNLYGYCGGDPTGNTDRSGHDSRRTLFEYMHGISNFDRHDLAFSNLTKNAGITKYLDSLPSEATEDIPLGNDITIKRVSLISNSNLAQVIQSRAISLDDAAEEISESEWKSRHYNSEIKRRILSGDTREWKTSFEVNRTTFDDNFKITFDLFFPNVAPFELSATEYTRTIQNTISSQRSSSSSRQNTTSWEINGKLGQGNKEEGTSGELSGKYGRSSTESTVNTVGDSSGVTSGVSISKTPATLYLLPVYARINISEDSYNNSSTTFYMIVGYITYYQDQ